MEQRIEVPAIWESIANLMSFSSEVECDFLLSDEQKYLLRLVIEEIATNIIKYGYDHGNHGVIQVACLCINNVLRVTIRDQGRPFDPRDIPPPDLQSDLASRAVGGLGIFLVREFSDDLIYHHDASSGWNELIVIKS